MQSRSEKGVKKIVIVFACLLYGAAVIYGDIMFFSIVSRIFPNGLLGTLAMVGAFVAGGTALLLPLALHWWHSRGTQQIAGYIFYAIDFAVLCLNAMLAYQLIQNGKLDLVFGTWLQICPATPLICAAGWAIVFSLDSSHQMRHAVQDLESEQIETYSKGLTNAANSPEVQAIIHQAAQRHAYEQVHKLLGLAMSSPALPAPTPQTTITQASSTKVPYDITGKFEVVPESDPLATRLNGQANGQNGKQ